MPPSSLETLSRLNISYPMLFKLEVRCFPHEKINCFLRIEAKSDKLTLVFLNLSLKKEKSTFQAG